MKNEHYWDVCTSCGPMVRCGTCGNNCCNGGSGELDDGSKCQDCESAYKKQETGPTNEDKIFLYDKLVDKLDKTNLLAHYLDNYIRYLRDELANDITPSDILKKPLEDFNLKYGFLFFTINE